MVMIFANPLVRAHLLEQGLVYTFRQHHEKTDDGIRLKVGKDWATDKRGGKKIADINITPVTPIDCANMEQVLTKYARESGFYPDKETLSNFYTGGLGRFNYAISEWALAIYTLNPDEPAKGWIYKVEVLKNQIHEQKTEGRTDA